MANEKIQINFQTSVVDAAAIDKLAKLDGYDNRSAWLRFQLRKVINIRRSEISGIVAQTSQDDALPLLTPESK